MPYHSQCEEDRFLNEHIFKNKQNGKYIELGALDGNLWSNTKFFEEDLNWSGILIEPHPEKFKGLQVNRPNNYVFNDLVSCHSDPLKFRYFVDDHAAVSGVENTLSKSHFDNFFENPNEWERSLPQGTAVIVPRTLTDIIKSTGITKFDLLSLDVEGHEYEVLKSWDFSVPIEVILIETIGYQPDKEEMCRVILRENGYKLMSSFSHNEIYIHNTSPYYYLTN